MGVIILSLMRSPTYQMLYTAIFSEPYTSRRGGRIHLAPKVILIYQLILEGFNTFFSVFSFDLFIELSNVFSFHLAHPVSKMENCLIYFSEVGEIEFMDSNIELNER